MTDQSIGRIVFTTPRLTIHLATSADAPFIHALWSDARVMRNVGFPKGLPVTLEQVQQEIQQRGSSEFSQLLIIRLKSSGEAIGQCLMKAPDENKIAETDVKLAPLFWGQRFGVEVKRGLLDYLFTHTDCVAVQATPHISNIASIKLQEEVGGVRVGEAVFEFPAAMRAYTEPVPHYIYRVTRAAWESQRAVRPEGNQNHETRTG